MLLLVVSETGLVYTFTTAKLQPLVTQPEGKNLIQACLNAPHGQLPTTGGGGGGGLPTPSPSIGSRMSAPHSNVPGGLSIGSAGAKEEDDDNDDGEAWLEPSSEGDDAEVAGVEGEDRGLRTLVGDGFLGGTELGEER